MNAVNRGLVGTFVDKQYKEMTNDSSKLNVCYGITEVLTTKKGDEVTKPLCTICHDCSSGFHYGTHACEGCKGFFRRMVTNVILVQSMLQCTGPNKNNCDINTTTRNNCQRCRLQKCFQMGMTRHKTRLGRRTKASAGKIESRINSYYSYSVLNDDDMMRYIKRESRYFNNNDTEDDEPSGKCIKHKAKLYSEKNSKYYHKYPKYSVSDSALSFDTDYNPNISQFCDGKSSGKAPDDVDQCLDSAQKLSRDVPIEITNFSHDKNVFGMSDFDISESRAMDFTQSFLNTLSPTSNTTISSGSTCDGPFINNSLYTRQHSVKSCNIIGSSCSKRTPMFESIRNNTEKLQIDKMCVKIRIFLAYDLDNEDFMLLSNYKRVITTLNRHFFNPNTNELDKFCRVRLNNIKYSNDPQLVFTEIKTEMIEMCTNILDFFRRLPDLELFQRITSESGIIKKKIIQTLAVWMIRFVNVSENILYNPKLSMRIPFSLLTQSPLRQFFETLFHLADIAKSILTTEIDDTELSFMSVLIITFPKKGFIHCSENMLQSDNFLKVRFLYSALLYEYMLTEKFHQNVDDTENQFQKFCWLINQSHLLQERDVNYMFSYLKL